MREHKISNLRMRLYFLSMIVLFTGLGSAGLIYYRFSPDYHGTGQIYENGQPVSPEDSKQYLRGLQLYGGAANVLADELTRWFKRLWQGRELALTIACIAIVVSAGIFHISRRLQ